MVQLSRSASEPGQESSAQVLVLTLSPVPQVTEQLEYDDHCVQVTEKYERSIRKVNTRIHLSRND